MENTSMKAEVFTEEEAVTEAKRCFLCKAQPCAQGCPGGSAPVTEFIGHIAKGQFAEAYAALAAAPDGRIHGEQAEPFCIRAKKNAGVSIGRLEQFAIDWHERHS